MKNKINLNMEEVRRLYLDERMSAKDISIRFNCSNGPVIRILNELGISRRPANLGRKLRPEWKEKIVQNLINSRKIRKNYIKRKDLWNKQNEIVSLYLEETDAEDLGKRFNCSPTTIRRILRANGIKINRLRPTERTKKKVSAGLQGVTLDKWRKFVRCEPYSQNWRTSFKNKIRERDNQVCMNCGIHRERLKKALHVHHVNYDKILTIPENCVSLCNNCHTLTNFNREYWQKLFQEKLSKLYGYKYDDKGNVVIDINLEETNNGI